MFFEFFLIFGLINIHKFVKIHINTANYVYYKII
jgi:hypothetical protein